MSRVKRNRELHLRVNKEISDIQAKNDSNKDISIIFESLNKIDSLYFKNIIKDFNDNNRSLNPFVVNKKSKEIIDDQIKINLSKALSEIENVEPVFSEVKKNKSSDYVYRDSEINEIYESLLQNKANRMRQNLDPEYRNQRAREDAFRDIDSATFNEYCKQEKRKLIPAIKEISSTIDDITDVNVNSYRRLKKRVKFKYYIWVYISCFIVVLLSVIGMIIILTTK